MSKEKQIQELVPLIYDKLCKIDGIYHNLTPDKMLASVQAYNVAEMITDLNYRKEAQGKWVDRYNGKYANPLYECSLCKKEALWELGVNELGSTKITQALSPICPHCSAKMKGDVQE